jgi:hypothetical protein
VSEPSRRSGVLASEASEGSAERSSAGDRREPRSAARPTDRRERDLEAERGAERPAKQEKSEPLGRSGDQQGTAGLLGPTDGALLRGSLFLQIGATHSKLNFYCLLYDINVDMGSRVQRFNTWCDNQNYGIKLLILLPIFFIVGAIDTILPTILSLFVWSVGFGMLLLFLKGEVKKLLNYDSN